ncbi:hypothetical protein F4806DRAFT_498118 [Annulohypoxylon nitens]|nr:hypothetical protein F4806DRAFT_498118 [Annulohypoxylon nitens]
MPSAQPICAARIIRSKHMKCGWGAVLSKETNDAVATVKDEANGMYLMQISRDRAVAATSLRTALFWERRNAPWDALVSVALPALSFELEVDLFCEGGSYEKGINAIERTYNSPMPDSTITRVNMHPVFGPIRDRPYTFWPIEINGIWVTVILKIEGHRVEHRDATSHRDRRVSKYTIIDPFQVDRMARRTLLQERLPLILEEGCIEFESNNPNVMTDSFLRSDVEESWATGLVSYAVCRELFRRLRVIDFRRQQKNDLSHDLLWREFEEDFNLDVYRQSLMAACAHKTIEKSGFIVRMALEVPSEKAEHNPDALLPPTACQPDEVYRKKHNSVRSVSSDLPGNDSENNNTSSSEESSADYDSEEDEEDITNSRFPTGPPGVCGGTREVEVKKIISCVGPPVDRDDTREVDERDTTEVPDEMDRRVPVGSSRLIQENAHGDVVAITPICTLQKSPPPAFQEPQSTNESSSPAPEITDAEIMPSKKRSSDDGEESPSKRQHMETGCDIEE